MPRIQRSRDNGGSKKKGEGARGIKGAKRRNDVDVDLGVGVEILIGSGCE